MNIFLPISITLLLFFFWQLLGQGVFQQLCPWRRDLSQILLSPALGLAVTLLFVFWLSRLGFSVSSFAAYLVLFLSLIALIGLLRTSRHDSFGGYAPFALVFFGAAFLVGWPTLLYGSNWLSLCNQDMANYSLLAQRFLDHGFFDVPLAKELFTGKDFSQTFWLQPLVERSGVELIQSWLAASLRIDVLRVYMPLILALHLVLLSSLAGVVVATGIDKKIALTATCMLAMSPLATLGVLGQLLGQTQGLAIMMGCLGTFTSIKFCGDRFLMFREALLASLLLSGLLITYPEVTPFLAATIAGWFFISVFRKSEAVNFHGKYLSFAALTLVFTVIFLGRYLLCAFTFLMQQVLVGTVGSTQSTDLFQQYFLPSGLAGLWGLTNIYAPISQPWLSLLIALGLILVVFTTIAAGVQMLRRNPLAIMFFVFLGGTLVLAGCNSAFGVYKIAMYIQPAMWTCFVIGWCCWCKNRILRNGFVTVLGVLCLLTQVNYTNLSRGEPSLDRGAFGEIPSPTATGLLDELDHIKGQAAGKTVISDTTNSVLAKFQALVLSDIKLSFPFMDIYPSKSRIKKIPQAPELEKYLEEFRAERSKQVAFKDFEFCASGITTKRSQFKIEENTQPQGDNDGGFEVLVSTALQSVMNRRHFADQNSSFKLIPWSRLQNHLLFVDSSLGRLYYSQDRKIISLYQLEPDPMRLGYSMAGVRENLVFQAINPAPYGRMMVELSASFKGDGENIIPKLVANGANCVPMIVVGRGSARVFSEPLEPQKIASRVYYGLHIEGEGKQRKKSRIGLMRLYGSSFADDPRKLEAFTRDISLISSDEFESLNLPREVDINSGGLWNKNLEYSGAFEDGWVAEESYFVLGGNKKSRGFLKIEGSVPQIGDQAFSTVFRVAMNGEKILEKDLLPGRFELQVGPSKTFSRNKITFSFSRVQRLPGGDDRQVAARIDKVLLTERASDGQDIVAADQDIIIGSNWYDLETFDGEKFRWVNNNAELILDTSNNGMQKTLLKIGIEPGYGIDQKPFWLEALDRNGRLLGKVLVSRRDDVELPLDLTDAVDNSIFLHLNETGKTVGADPRILNFRIFRISFSQAVAN